MHRGLLAVVLAVGIGAAGSRPVAAQEASGAEVRQLRERVERLEQRVGELEKAVQPVQAKAEAESQRARLQAKARERMRADAQRYNRDQLREIETLYQVANKQWRSPEAKESLEKLVETYRDANRTGCALLYLAQFSEGDERERYLLAAIKDHADCWYGDGVQVGAYARFYLAHYYQETGKKDEAARVDQEIRDQYPDAIDHRGQPLAGRLATDTK